MKYPNPVTFNANDFTWTCNHGVTDISDTWPPRSGIPGGLIYDDSADFVFVVQGILFLFLEVICDRDGVLQGWKFVSECGQFYITIAND